MDSLKSTLSDFFSQSISPENQNEGQEKLITIEASILKLLAKKEFMRPQKTTCGSFSIFCFRRGEDLNNKPVRSALYLREDTPVMAGAVKNVRRAIRLDDGVTVAFVTPKNSADLPDTELGPIRTLTEKSIYIITPLPTLRTLNLLIFPWAGKSLLSYIEDQAIKMRPRSFFILVLKQYCEAIHFWQNPINWTDNQGRAFVDVKTANICVLEDSTGHPSSKVIDLESSLTLGWHHKNDTPSRNFTPYTYATEYLDEPCYNCNEHSDLFGVGMMTIEMLNNEKIDGLANYEWKIFRHRGMCRWKLWREKCKVLWLEQLFQNIATDTSLKPQAPFLKQLVANDHTKRPFVIEVIDFFQKWLENIDAQLNAPFPVIPFPELPELRTSWNTPLSNKLQSVRFCHRPSCLPSPQVALDLDLARLQKETALYAHWDRLQSKRSLDAFGAAVGRAVAKQNIAPTKFCLSAFPLIPSFEIHPLSNHSLPPEYVPALLLGTKGNDKRIDHFFSLKNNHSFIRFGYSKLPGTYKHDCDLLPSIQPDHHLIRFIAKNDTTLSLFVTYEGISINDYLYSYLHSGLPSNELQELIPQLLSALDFLSHMDDKALIHTAITADHVLVNKDTGTVAFKLAGLSYATPASHIELSPFAATWFSPMRVLEKYTKNEPITATPEIDLFGVAALLLYAIDPEPVRQLTTLQPLKGLEEKNHQKIAHQRVACLENSSCYFTLEQMLGLDQMISQCVTLEKAIALFPAPS